MVDDHPVAAPLGVARPGHDAAARRGDRRAARAGEIDPAVVIGDRSAVERAQRAVAGRNLPVVGRVENARPVAGRGGEALMRRARGPIGLLHFRRQQRRVGTVDLQVLGRPVDRRDVQRGFLPEQRLAARAPDRDGQRRRTGRGQRVDSDEAEEAIAVLQQRIGLALPGDRGADRARRVGDDQHRVPLRGGARRDVDQRRGQRLGGLGLLLALFLLGLLIRLGGLRRLLGCRLSALLRGGLLLLLPAGGRRCRLLVRPLRGERIQPLPAAGRQQQARARAAHRAQHRATADPPPRRRSAVPYVRRSRHLPWLPIIPLSPVCAPLSTRGLGPGSGEAAAESAMGGDEGRRWARIACNR